MKNRTLKEGKRNNDELKVNKDSSWKNKQKSKNNDKCAS